MITAALLPWTCTNSSLGMRLRDRQEPLLLLPPLPVIRDLGLLLAW